MHACRSVIRIDLFHVKPDKYQWQLCSFDTQRLQHQTGGGGVYKFSTLWSLYAISRKWQWTVIIITIKYVRYEPSSRSPTTNYLLEWEYTLAYLSRIRRLPVLNTMVKFAPNSFEQRVFFLSSFFMFWLIHWITHSHIYFQAALNMKICSIVYCSYYSQLWHDQQIIYYRAVVWCRYSKSMLALFCVQGRSALNNPVHVRCT